MRHVLRTGLPPVTRILLVESGSRQLIDNVLPHLRHVHGDVRIDLVTCFAGQPAGIDAASASIYRVSDYATPEARKRLYKELGSNGYQVVGILCSAEPVMTKWKWMLAARLPAKLFLLNENGDYVWFDRSNTSTLLEFARVRTGLAGAGAVRTIMRLLVFPFTLSFLILYATAVHLRRALRSQTP